MKTLIYGVIYNSFSLLQTSMLMHGNNDYSKYRLEC